MFNWIISEARETYEEKDDLPVLYRKLVKILNLAPDGPTKPFLRRFWGSCQSVVEPLGSLRNKIGDAHSPGPKTVKPAARHAQLAVNLSGTGDVSSVDVGSEEGWVDPTCTDSRPRSDRCI